MRLQAVLFDAAGTLIVPVRPIGETYAHVAERHGVELPAWRIEDGFRRIHAAAPPMVFPDAPAEEIASLERDWWRSRVRETFKATDQTAHFADFDGFFDALFAHFARAEAWRPCEGAVEALAALRREGRRLAVASNFDHRLPPILQAHGLRGFFERVWGPGEARAAKPEAAFFARLLETLGVAPDAAVHVGDDAEADVAGARRAGLAAVALGPPATLHDLPQRIRALEGGS